MARADWNEQGVGASEVQTPSAGRRELDAAIDGLASQIAESMTITGQKTVAILDFVSMQKEAGLFGRFLSEELISRLFLTERFEVVERRFLDEVLKEQELSVSDFFDDDSVKELGRLLGVDAVLVGTYADVGSEIRANGRLISIETGKLCAVANEWIAKDVEVLTLLRTEQAKPPMQKTSTATPSPATSATHNAFQQKSLDENPVHTVTHPANFRGASPRTARNGSAKAGERPDGRPPRERIRDSIENASRLYNQGRFPQSAVVAKATLADPYFDRFATAHDLGWVSFILTEEIWQKSGKNSSKRSPQAKGSYEQPLRLAKKAMKMDSTAPMAMCAWAQVLLRTGRKQDAENHFDKALKLDPYCRKMPHFLKKSLADRPHRRPLRKGLRQGK